MTANDKRAERRVPVALRIRLRYSDVDQFISKFAINISRGGMFLSSRNPKAIGTHLQFEMRLADDSPVIEGSGEVRWIREYDRQHPNQPHGMGIKFFELKPESQAVLERIIEHRRSVGEPDTDSIPVPRAQEAAGAAPLPAVASLVTQPVPEPRVEQPPPAVAAPAPPPVVAAPAPPPVVAAPPVRPAGMEAALARARELAGALVDESGDIERELAALLEPVVVPVEGSVDAASRELAERLGGVPVVRGQPGAPAVSRPSASNGVDDTGTSLKVDPADVLEERDAGAPHEEGEDRATPRADRGRGRTARG
jgi:uncharacterized protein (TIGR02266 family)